MSALVNLTGKRFGRLVVLRLEETRGNKHSTNAVWLCQCDCGREKLAYSMNLQRGNTTSCGCYSRERHSKMLKEMWAMWKEAKGRDHDKATAEEAGT